MTPYSASQSTSTGDALDPAFADLLVSRLQACHDPKEICLPAMEITRDDENNTDADKKSGFELRRADGPPQPIPARQLLTCLRLAATFGSVDTLAALVDPGAFTVLRGFDVPDLDLIARVLKDVFPEQRWSIAKPSVDADAISKSAEERFLRQLNTLLDSRKPVLVLQPVGVTLPTHLRQPGIRTFDFAPISADILLGYLSAEGRAPEDAQAFRNALPEPAILARFDTAQICTALRLGSGISIAERLCALAKPADSGPRLDEGFSDSPAVRAARRIVADLLEWRRGGIAWSDFSHSLLLYGPPGTGKTWLARAMGNSGGIACVTGSFAEWQAAGHLGDMLREMRRTFAIARKSAPAILFIDEIDAIGSRTGDDRHNQNYRTQVINGFLGEMNALATEPGVIVVGACNHPDRIDPAVTRAGRFDLKAEVPMPDAQSILALLRQHLTGHSADDDLHRLARQAVGHSLASVDAAIRAARSEARHARKPFDLATLRGQLRLESEQDIHDILWRYAVHEAGHAVLGAALRLGRIERMAISATGGELASRPVVAHGMLADIENEIAHDLAGRAAERLVFGEVSAGAGGPVASDLSKATQRALAIETNWGLGELGPLWMPAPEAVLMTDETLRTRVRARLEAAEASAAKILTTHETHLLGLAKELLDKRSMTASEILPWVRAIQYGSPLPEGSTMNGRSGRPEP